MRCLGGQEEAWAEAVRINDDPYGRSCIRFTERWADLMETRVAAGEAVKDVARATSREADTAGITVFMYGCAVSLLAQCWVHGEELRRWHNIDTQLGTEGEAANASGGVLNPALLSIG